MKNMPLKKLLDFLIIISIHNYLTNLLNKPLKKIVLNATISTCQMKINFANDKQNLSCKKLIFWRKMYFLLANMYFCNKHFFFVKQMALAILSITILTFLLSHIFVVFNCLPLRNNKFFFASNSFFKIFFLLLHK